MEKSNSGRIIAVIALVIAVIGLSVGFAAFSSTLNISSTANAEIGNNLWNVGFADATSGNMADLTTPTSVAGSSSNGSLNMLKYTLSQGTAATLSTVSGSSVTYNFKIKNEGEIDATLNSITAGGLTCAYSTNSEGRTIEEDAQNTGARVTQGTGTISDTDCRTMFTATLTIGGTDYNITTTSVSPTTYNSTITAGSSIDASLTIAATGTTPSTVPNGDFTVTLGNTTVVYGS